MKQPWTNRITRYSEESPDQLLAHPQNARLHPRSQQDALKGVLTDVGIVQNIVVSEATGHVLDGHLRVSLALRDGQPTVPVTWVNVSEQEESLILATLDPLSAAAAWDREKLDDLLRDVSTSDAAVQQLLADLAEQVGIPSVQPVGNGGDDFDVDEALDGDCRVQLGDIWTIGGVHRICCGDSTDAATVARLMDGERVNLCFTSPPYDQQRTYNGNMVADWRGLVSGVFLTALPHLDDDAQLFVNLGLVHRDGRVIKYWDGLIADIESAEWPLFGWYVWDKLNGMPGDWGGRLAPAHEWIFHFARNHIKPAKTIVSKRAGEKHSPTKTQRNPDGTVKSFTSNDPVQPFKIPDSVIRLVQHQARGIEILHPAVFPIALPETFMQAYHGELWLDPFLGSGTTLIAAHRTNRRCYGLELEPRYCEVILKRAEAEGLTVERTFSTNS